jgi:hypothetical protein
MSTKERHGLSNSQLIAKMLEHGFDWKKCREQNDSANVVSGFVAYKNYNVYTREEKDGSTSEYTRGTWQLQRTPNSIKEVEDLVNKEVEDFLKGD